MSKIEPPVGNTHLRSTPEPLKESFSQYQAAHKQTPKRTAPETPVATKKEKKKSIFARLRKSFAVHKKQPAADRGSLTKSGSFQRVLEESGSLSRTPSMKELSFANGATGTGQPKATPSAPQQKRRTVDENKQLLQNLIQNDRVAPKIKEELMAPLSVLKERHDVALFNLMGGGTKNMDVLARLENGLSADETLPGFKHKAEYQTLQDSRAFLGRLEERQLTIASLAVNLTDKTASPEDRLHLSKLLRQTQAETSIVKEHLAHQLASQVKNFSGGRATEVMAMVISLEALNQRISAHHEVCDSFLSRYAASLPDVSVAATDEGQQERLELASLSQALGTKESQLREKKQPDQANLVGQAKVEVDKQLNKLNKTLQTQEEAMAGGASPRRRLAKKVGLKSTPPPVLNLPEALQPTPEMLRHARGKVVNRQQWGEVKHSFLLRGRDYTSVLTPASAEQGVARHMEPTYEGSAAVQGANHHVPNLATTRLENEEGKTLYKAVRHAALDSSGINAAYLADLSRAEMNDLFSRYYRGGTESFGRVDGFVDFVQERGGAMLDIAVGRMKDPIDDNMASEVVKAAVLDDVVLYRQAHSRSSNVPQELNANSAALSVPLNAVNLMGEGAQKQTQLAALRRLAEKAEPFNLKLKNKETGDVFYAPVRLDLREFNFNIESSGNSFSLDRLFQRNQAQSIGWGFKLDKQNEKSMVALLGNKRSNEIGGAVGAKIEETQNYLTMAQNLHEEAQSASAANHRNGDTYNVYQLEQKVFTLAREGLALSQTAEQLKAMWQKGEYLSTADQQNKFTGRLALLCSQIGQPAVLSDSNGMDRVNGCDAEAKYLASILDSAGLLPAPDAISEERNKMGDVLLAGGGMELRRYNDGLTG